MIEDTPAPLLSLCMIVRDEEDCLDRCLYSAKDLVDEIVIADTGSADKSRVIAAQHGAIVIESPWENNFALARNVSLNHAKGAWILILDADEALDRNSHQIIRAMLQRPPAAYEFVQRHYTDDIRIQDFCPARGEFADWEGNYAGYFETKVVRLFPSHPDIRFRGHVHEIVEPSIRELGTIPVINSEIRIHHYGHTAAVVSKKRKEALYLTIGIKKAQNSPNDFKAFYELGISANLSGDRLLSRDALRRSLNLNPAYLPTYINLGYVLCELAEYDEAVQVLESALLLDPFCAEAYCNRGVVFLRRKNHAAAAQSFTKAIECKPDYINAYTNLATAFLWLNQKRRALGVLERALKYQPESPQLKKLISELSSDDAT